MALSVDYVYQFALNLIRKNQAGSLSSVEFARHWNDSQGSYQDDLLGRFQSRSNGKSGGNTGLIENRTIMQKLAPFTVKHALVFGIGTAAKPEDFIYELALTVNGFEVKHINHNQRSSVVNNAIDPPSIEDNCYYVITYEDYYEFLPSTVTEATLDYIRTPVDVFWNFSLSGGRQTYQSVGSVQPEWDNNSCREITKRMLTNLGVSFKDNDFLNFGRSTQLTGE